METVIAKNTALDYAVDRESQKGYPDYDAKHVLDTPLFLSHEIPQVLDKHSVPLDRNGQSLLVGNKES